MRNDRIRIRQRLRAAERLLRRRIASPAGLALGFAGGVAMGTLRPGRMLTSGRIWSPLAGAVLQWLGAALFRPAH